jgi:protocatechuate 3,4-dioxygenase beta subunit
VKNTPPETGAFFARDREWHPAAYVPIYKTSVARSPQRALLSFDSTKTEITGPAFGHNMLGQLDNDLILNYARPGEMAIGQRILVHGRVMDERGKGVGNTLVEFWQANAGGRYRHKKEGYMAPLDPNFGGVGRTITDDDGFYWFKTIKPGPYPWPNGPNDWRPAHIHFSVFGRTMLERLITQMYFPGDPLLGYDPIFNGVPSERARERLISHFDLEATQPEWALGYHFDIVLRGPEATPDQPE